MRESQRLSFPEFMTDLRGVILSPRRQFQVVQERQTLWGSLLLLLFPVYFTLAWTPGLGTKGIPGPAYSFLFPLLLAAVATLCKLYPIHIFGRLFQRRREHGPQGSFRQLVAVFGYTTIPNVLALVFAFTIMLSLSETIGGLFRSNRVAAISGAIALGLALFVWHFILVVLALRTVYPLRDAMIVAVFIAGSIVGGGGSWLLSMPLVKELKVDTPCLEPILQDRVLRFHSVEPGVTIRETIQMPIDRLRYRFQVPARLELVVFKSTGEYGRAYSESEGERPTANRPKKSSYQPWLAGRILGLPGEQVTVMPSGVTVDGRSWTETYLAPGYAMTGSFVSRKLGAEEYLVLPDNRNLVAIAPGEWYVPRARIEGRLLVVKWPIGVLIHRPSLFDLPPQIVDR